MTTPQQAFAEVIESSLQIFSACCWQWDVAPHFGSVVTIRNDVRILYAIVYKVQTISLDPMREIHVYKKTEDEMKKEYPHLFEFLKTTFSAMIIGYQEQNHYYFRPLTMPAKLYSFVTYATDDELRQFFNDTRSMKIILSPGVLLDQPEDLIFSIVETQKRLCVFSPDHLASVMKHYALSTNASYRQLKTFFDRIS